jgi:hypothetical protein
MRDEPPSSWADGFSFGQRTAKNTTYLRIGDVKASVRQHGIWRHSICGILLTLVLSGLLSMNSFAESTSSIVQFRSPHRSLMVVDVRVNGLGPYAFIFDTGATSSCIDQELYTTLRLPTTADVTVASWTDTTDVRHAMVQNLSLGPLHSGPLYVLVQPMLEFKMIVPHVHGVLGQDVLLRSNYLIDNQHHRIEFDEDGDVLLQLVGAHTSALPVLTRIGAVEMRLRSVQVQSDMKAEPLQLLLDSGAEMVVLQPGSVRPSTPGRGMKWIANQNGKLSPATSFHTTLSIGSSAFTAEAWMGDRGMAAVAIDGLLPTGSFNQLYICNTESFVIFEPRRTRHK